MIGPGALSQTRVRRVTVTLGAVGSAGIKRHCEHREEAYTYSVCVCVCVCVCVHTFQVGKREDEKEKRISVSRGEIKMEVADSPGLVLVALDLPVMLFPLQVTVHPPYSSIANISRVARGKVLCWLGRVHPYLWVMSDSAIVYWK